MDLPIYCVVDTRPVKVVGNPDGTLDVLAFDPASGDFVRRMDLLERVIMQDECVIELTEEEFEARVAALSPKGSRRVG
ncbi:MAG: hypothetical protein IRZ16_03440 [Myxococcaceae bacterium]|nr:hypothetical protein [Myxococcaceae bacterium]